MTDFSAQRADLAEKLQSLREARGAAICDNKKFAGNDEIAAVEAAVMALNDAEAIGTVRARQEEEAARRAAIEAARSKLAPTYSRYLAGVAEAYECFVDGREALAKANADRDEMAKLCQTITGGAPMPLSKPDWASRISLHIAAAMSALPDYKHRFGALSWPASFAKSTDDWRQCEAERLDKHIQPITQEAEAHHDSSSERITSGNGTGNGRA